MIGTIDAIRQAFEVRDLPCVVHSGYVTTKIGDLDLLIFIATDRIRADRDWARTTVIAADCTPATRLAVLGDVLDRLILEAE